MASASSKSTLEMNESIRKCRQKCICNFGYWNTADELLKFSKRTCSSWWADSSPTVRKPMCKGFFSCIQAAWQAAWRRMNVGDFIETVLSLICLQQLLVKNPKIHVCLKILILFIKIIIQILTILQKNVAWSIQMNQNVAVLCISASVQEFICSF